MRGLPSGRGVQLTLQLPYAVEERQKRPPVVVWANRPACARGCAEPGGRTLEKFMVGRAEN